MPKNYILAFDQGTTSSRTIVFDPHGRIQATAAREFPQVYPRPGWVEHDPEIIWDTQLDTAKAAMGKAGIDHGDVAAIGITNQRETTVVWDRKTGKPVYNAIVWQCRRTADLCERLARDGLTEMFRERTGLVPDPYFSGTKVAWILDHVDGARARADMGELAFGTMDTWLLYKLTGKHATDYSNASRTLLYNIHNLEWDPELPAILNVPRGVLPEVHPTSFVYGTTSIFGGDIPIAALCGDQQSALFGQAAFSPRECKNTYGTGCFVLMNTGEQPATSSQGLLTTIAWGMGNRIEYALEGSVFIGGAVIQWLRDELGLIEHAAESEAIARQVPDTGGVYVVPAFVGLGAPHWDMHARGAIVGLTRGSGRAHIVRAALESIAYQSGDVIRSMESDTGSAIGLLKVDGGAATNDLLMQHQTDVLGIPVSRGKVLETTALGAAFFAGLATGVWPDREALRAIREEDRVFTPQWDATTRKTRLAGWKQAVAMVSTRGAHNRDT